MMEDLSLETAPEVREEWVEHLMLNFNYARYAWKEYGRGLGTVLEYTMRLHRMEPSCVEGVFKLEGFDDLVRSYCLEGLDVESVAKATDHLLIFGQPDFEDEHVSKSDIDTMFIRLRDSLVQVANVLTLGQLVGGIEDDSRPVVLFQGILDRIEDNAEVFQSLALDTNFLWEKGENDSKELGSIYDSFVDTMGRTAFKGIQFN
tara:strand:- start:65 stop:673 length:609 start_codon:yes stop_codon:yes gene_type:complete